jgi:protein-disulfide isomerase
MSNTPKDSKRTTKDKAAAARAAAEAEQRRRDRRVRIIGGVAILVVVGLIVGIGVYGSRKNAAAGGVVADASVPSGVNTSDGDYPWGVPAAAPASGKPTLAIWEDFQCPSCGDLERTSGAGILKLATDGKVTLVWRPTTFLDPRFVTGPNPNSSARATMAWGCAIDAGKTDAYHSTVFANQPATEGDGWTDQQLLDFGKQAGITGDAYTKFADCYNNKRYDQWVTNSATTFQDDAIPGTPTAFLNGTEVPAATLKNLAELEKAITAATGK